MPNICYFEIPVEEMAKAQAFYESMFGWRFEKLLGKSEEVDYWRIHTGGSSDDYGLTIGGILKKQGPLHTATQYVNVESLEASIQQLEKLGGSMRVPKTPIAGMGYFAIGLDLDDNAIGLWETDESAKE